MYMCYYMQTVTLQIGHIIKAVSNKDKESVISCGSLQVEVSSYWPLIVVCLVILWNDGLWNTMGITEISKKLCRFGNNNLQSARLYNATHIGSIGGNGFVLWTEITY